MSPPRIKTYLATSAAITLVVVAHHAWNHQDSWPYTSADYVYSLLPFKDARPSRWPTGSDASKGYWSLDQEHRNDTVAWRMDGTCLATTAVLDSTTNRPIPMEEDAVRGQEVNGWEWLLEDGSQLQSWNSTEVLTRALQSRLGFIMVGGTHFLF